MIHRKLAVLLAVGLAAPALAQTDTTHADPLAEARPTGFQAGVYPLLGGFGLDDSEEETGLGLALRVGYGFTPAVAAYLRADGSTFGGEVPFTVGHVEGGVRVAFANRRNSNTFLYVEGGVAREVMAFDLEGENVKFSGMGGTLAFGVVAFTAPNFGIDASFGGIASSLNRIEVDGESGEMDDPLRSHHIRLSVGGTWFPGR